MIGGFEVKGFRNFGSEGQWVGPLSRVNVFIGTNNSGKSNLLRFVDRVVAPAVTPGRSKGIGLSGVDLPRTGGGLESFLWEVSLKDSSVYEKLASRPEFIPVLKSLGVLDDSEKALIPVRVTETPRGQYYAGEIPNAAPHEARTVQQIFAKLTGISGGSFPAWFAETMNVLIRESMFSIKPHFIPSFRQLTSRLEEFASEYPQDHGGVHLIDELAGLAHPSYDEQEKKEKFEKLRLFVGEILSDDQVQIEIPADRKTINVKSGDNFLPIEALGSGVHEVFMLASELILRDEKTILLEEPEVHLHPHLQRRLMSFIMTKTEAQYFITTHSASIIDTKGASIFGVSKRGSAQVRPLLTDQAKFRAAQELGYRSSDLLQSNYIVWVEGPSDRIYINDWIKAEAPELAEGIDYSIVFYGGKLLSHLSAEDRQLDDFIALLPLCRNLAVVVDSDQGAPNASIRETKLRVRDELAEIGGTFWLTNGREIENYYEFADREAAVKKVHPSAEKLSGNRSRYGKPLNYLRENGEEVKKGFDKVKIARALVEDAQPREEAIRQVQALVANIRNASR